MALLVAAGGAVEGTVHFEGEPPAAVELKKSSDPFCAKHPELDGAVEVWSGRLQNVVVHVVGARSRAPHPAEPLVIDQVGCSYRPRVSVAREGQRLAVRNSDGTLHNVHAYAGTRTLVNRAQPPRAEDLVAPALPFKDPIKLKCDVHPWMTGWVLYADSPYFAVTGRDGRFRIEGLPPGQHTLVTWHEKLGLKVARLKVARNQSTRIDFRYSNEDPPPSRRPEAWRDRERAHLLKDEAASGPVTQLP